MPRNAGDMWDGRLSNPETDLAVLQDPSPVAQAVRELTSELIATQTGLVNAGRAVKETKAHMADLEARADGDTKQVLQASIDAQNNLVAVTEQVINAMMGFCERLAGSQDSAATVRVLGAIQAAVANNQEVTADAIKTLSAQLLELKWAESELLGDFDTDDPRLALDRARWWISQAKRCMGYFARYFDVPADNVSALADQPASILP